MDRKSNKANQTLNTNWGITNINVEKVSFTWTITNFYACYKLPGEKLISPSFSTVINNNEYKWHLEIYPFGNSEATKDHISLYLYLDSGNSIKVTCIFSTVNKSSPDGDNIQLLELKFFQTGRGFGFEKFLRRDWLLSSLDSGNLVIKCEICRYVNTTTLCVQNQALEESTLVHDLIDDLKALWNDEKLSDMELFVGGRKFKVHKAILAARSTVFAAMFMHSMKEAEEAVVEISDIKPEVMEELLRFVYTGKVKSFVKIVNDLLVASDKYNIQGLKVQCEDFLRKSISVDNVLDLLLLADVYKADKLKSDALYFTALNAAKIIDKEEFNSFKDSSSHLVNEAFSILAKMK